MSGARLVSVPMVRALIEEKMLGDHLLMKYHLPRFHGSQRQASGKNREGS